MTLQYFLCYLVITKKQRLLSCNNDIVDVVNTRKRLKKKGSQGLRPFSVFFPASVNI